MINRDITNSASMASLSLNQNPPLGPQEYTHHHSPRHSVQYQNPQPQLQPQAQHQYQQPRQPEPQPQRHYQQRQPAEEPLAAPQPTRAAPINPISTMPVGMWSPEMGIRFGGPAPGGAPPPQANAQQQQQQQQQQPLNNNNNKETRWDPSMGLRFA